MSNKQMIQLAPETIMDREVKEVFKHGYNADEKPQLVQRGDVTVYRVKVHGEELVAKARFVSDASREHMVDKETRKKHFLDFLAERGLNCAPCVGQGVFNHNEVQVVVTQAVKGKHVDLEDFVINMLKNSQDTEKVIQDQTTSDSDDSSSVKEVNTKSRELIQAIGNYLADFHTASREYGMMHYEHAVRYPDYDKVAESFQCDFVQPSLPKTTEHFGITHGDLCEHNWLIDQSGSQCEVAVFDWDTMHKSWYIADLGTVVYELTQFLFDSRNVKSFKRAQGLEAAQQVVDWLCEAYTARCGYKINREQLLEATHWRRDFLANQYDHFFSSGKFDTQHDYHFKKFYTEVLQKKWEFHKVVRAQKTN